MPHELVANVLVMIDVILVRLPHSSVQKNAAVPLNVQLKLGDTSSPEELVRNFSMRFRSAEWPAEHPLPEVYYDVHSVELDQGKRGALHAKCIVVDEHRVFVSSANLTEAAQKRNIEAPQ